MTILTGLAYMFAALLVIAFTLVLWLARIAPGDVDRRIWPWPAIDTWSLLADVGWLALWCFAVAWSVRRCVRDWADDHDVRLWPVAIAAAFATETSSSTAVSSVTGFALVVVVARHVALTPRPAPRWAPSRAVRAAVVAACVALALAALSYQPFHPLSYSFDGRESHASFEIGNGADYPRSQRAMAFMIGNEGIADLTVSAIQAPAGGADIAISLSTDTYSRLDAARLDEGIARDDTMTGELRATAAGCRGLIQPRYLEVSTLDVRYETLGMTRTQHLVIDPPARLRCPAR